MLKVKWDSGDVFLLLRRPLSDLWLGRRQKGEYPCFDLVGCEGFADVTLGSGCDGSEDERLASFGGDHDGRDPRRQVLTAACLEKLEAIHYRHVNVADDERKRAGGAAFVAKCLEGLFAVRGLQNLGELKASLAECPFDYFSHDCRIINN